MAFDRNLSRGLQSAIDNTPIEDGKLRFAVDTARIFLDLKNSRVEFTDFIRGLTRNEILNLSTPLPKIYLSSDTYELMLYHKNKWISFGGGSHGVDGLGQIIHETYIKGFDILEDGTMIAIRGDDEIIPVGEASEIFAPIMERLEYVEEECARLRNELDDLNVRHEELKAKYEELEEKHEALASATTEWGGMPTESFFGEIDG